jgi:hypothetical protein
MTDDYHPVIRDLVEECWASHPDRELLERLANERDEVGQLAWEQFVLNEPARVTLWLRPVDPRADDPLGVLIGSWTPAEQTRRERAALARLNEDDG